MLSITHLPKLKKQFKKLVYNNLKKIIFLLFLCFSYSLNGQSNLLIKEEINGSFSQGTMNGAIDRYFSHDTYYLRSNFNVKIGDLGLARTLEPFNNDPSYINSM